MPRHGRRRVAFGQHRKFPPHARKTSGTQGSINWVSVQKNLGQHPLGTKQTARSNERPVLRGCRCKAGFPSDRLVIAKKEKKRKENKQGEEDEENLFRLVCRYCDLLLFKEHYSYCKCQLRKEERKEN